MVHSREADLIAGTHGRGVYVLDITKNKGARSDSWFAADNPHSNLLDLPTARYVMGEGGELAPPGAAIYYYLKNVPEKKPEITIIDEQGRIIRHLSSSVDQGLNKVVWDLRSELLSPPPGWQFEGSNDAVRLGQEGFSNKPDPLVQPGVYTVILKISQNTWEKPV